MRFVLADLHRFELIIFLWENMRTRSYSQVRHHYGAGVRFEEKCRIMVWKLWEIKNTTTVHTITYNATNKSHTHTNLHQHKCFLQRHHHS